MEPSARIFTFLGLLLLPMHSSGYSSGKVEPACKTMIPQHETVAQTSPSPYSVSFSSVNHTGILGLKVTITKDSNAPDFKGFMIQAREPNGDTPQGTFVVNSTDAQTLSCDGPENAVSHTSGSPKSQISVIWLPPKEATTNMQFRATVVQVRSTFWTNLKSDVIQLKNGGHQLLATALTQLLVCSIALIYTLFTS